MSKLLVVLPAQPKLLRLLLQAHVSYQHNMNLLPVMQLYCWCLQTSNPLLIRQLQLSSPHLLHQTTSPPTSLKVVSTKESPTLMLSSPDTGLLITEACSPNKVETAATSWHHQKTKTEGCLPCLYTLISDCTTCRAGSGSLSTSLLLPYKLCVPQLTADITAHPRIPDSISSRRTGVL